MMSFPYLFISQVLSYLFLYLTCCLCRVAPSCSSSCVHETCVFRCVLLLLVGIIARVDCCACYYHVQLLLWDIYFLLFWLLCFFVGVLSRVVAAAIADLVVCGVRGGVVSRGVRHFDEYCFSIIQHPLLIGLVGIFLVVVPVKSRKGWWWEDRHSSPCWEMLPLLLQTCGSRPLCCFVLGVRRFDVFSNDGRLFFFFFLTLWIVKEVVVTYENTCFLSIWITLLKWTMICNSMSLSLSLLGMLTRDLLLSHRDVAALPCSNSSIA
jgi:hypothetical protein